MPAAPMPYPGVRQSVSHVVLYNNHHPENHDETTSHCVWDSGRIRDEFHGVSNYSTTHNYLSLPPSLSFSRFLSLFLSICRSFYVYICLSNLSIYLYIYDTCRGGQYRAIARSFVTFPWLYFRHIVCCTATKLFTDFCK